MKFTAAAVVSAFVATAAAQDYGYGYSNNTVPEQPVPYNGPQYTTEVVTEYTTYCPYATTFTEGTQTYTVTAPTTITVTNCPCTRTYTYSTVSVTSCPGGCAPTTPVTPPVYTAPPANSGTPVPPTTPVYTAPPATYAPPAPNNTVPVYTAPPAATNAAGRATVASGALAVMVGLAAALL